MRILMVCMLVLAACGRIPIPDQCKPILAQGKVCVFVINDPALTYTK